MAHGGDGEWNQAVVDAVEPLRAPLPTALAFGMADPTSLAAGVDSLSGCAPTRPPCSIRATNRSTRRFVRCGRARGSRSIDPGSQAPNKSIGS